jgi:tetratricopeptide (TPR) repeat protein
MGWVIRLGVTRTRMQAREHFPIRDFPGRMPFQVASEAVIEFEDAAALARSGGLLFLEIDALHMLAIADTARSRERAAEAIDRALAAPDDRTRRWLVSLYNNLGCSYSEAGDLDQALAAFLQAQEWADRVGTGQQRAWALEAVEECTAARRARDAR